MSFWKDVINQKLGDPYQELSQFRAELNRRLNYAFSSVARSQVKKITTLTDTATLTLYQKGYIICNKGTAMTLNLPTITGNLGLEYNIINVGAGTVTLDPNSSETIVGGATMDVLTDESFNILATATEWRVTG